MVRVIKVDDITFDAMNISEEDKIVFWKDYRFADGMCHQVQFEEEQNCFSCDPYKLNKNLTVNQIYVFR